MPELIFIFLLALVILGPRKLPELGRQLGKALSEFKKASNEFKSQLETEMVNIELEERAKRKQEEAADTPSILPPESSGELPYKPAQGIVSRGAPEQIAASPTSQPESSAHDPIVKLKTASPDA